MHLAWLERALSDAERDSLVQLVGQLSTPEAAQLLPAFARLDRWQPFSPLARGLLDSLGMRGSPNVAGAVRVAYLAARLRRENLAGMQGTGLYATEFRGLPMRLPGTQATASNADTHGSVRFSLDYAPAESLLSMLSASPSATPLERRLRTDAFDALIRHRSQRFLPVALSRELLALSLAFARSDEPIHRLYRYAFPHGWYHYADVRENSARYRRVLQELRRNERAIAAWMDRRLVPFIPAGIHVDRRLSLYFGDGADGWASRGVVAADLEYFKDDYSRFLGTALHETFHAVQSAATTARSATSRRTAPATSARDSLMSAILDAIQLEGTANYVAPAAPLSAAEADVHVRRAVGLLVEVGALPDSALTSSRRNSLLGQGLSAGGPFYWLGAAMARKIDQTLGRTALLETVGRSGVDFYLTYARAAQSASDDNLLPAAVDQYARAREGQSLRFE